MQYKKVNTIYIPVLIFIAMTGAWTGFEKMLPSQPEENQVLDSPLKNLSPSQNNRFSEGDEAFNEVFTPQTGLGPYYVSNSCGSCHLGDCRGHPSNILTRFGKYQGGQFSPLRNLGGPQLQNRAIPGFNPERLPEQATGITRFIAPPVTGLGYLAAIPDAAILKMTDPNDQDGDRISGKPNYIRPPGYFKPKDHHIPDSAGRYIGRFGRKAGAITLLHQSVNAYKEDIGITTIFDPDDPVNYDVSGQNLDKVPDPEVPASTVRNVVFYLRTLKSPIPRKQDDPAVIAGKQIFMKTGCESCHKSTLKTGNTDLSVLSNKVIHPYTDLLLHDMGPALDDGYTEGTASTAEWRTPPLWGLGLAKDFQGGEYYLMHDGRARSIKEAIMLHGGEAAKSRDNFQQLNKNEQDQLIRFLESL